MDLLDISNIYAIIDTMLDMHALFELSTCMDLEPAEEHGCPGVKNNARQDAVNIYRAKLPNGKQIALFKSLLSSVCKNDCFYCPFRVGRDFRRFSLQPDEFASLFMDLHRAGIANGLFISSGIVKSGVFTQDKLLDAAEILRKHHKFEGYLHLKLMPGAEKDQVVRAMQLADRVSINLEAPNDPRLKRLSAEKDSFEELYKLLRWVAEIRRSRDPREGWKGHWPSTSTQFVVGGADESDLELLEVTQSLFRTLGLKRTYYSPFRPFPGTPLENHPPGEKFREHRLYQASFLLREYGFDVAEIPLDDNNNLVQACDPKLAWAEKNLSEKPLELNKANRSELLRIPGIGTRSANAILVARRLGLINDLSMLSRLGIQADRAAPFILLNGKRPSHQRSFGF
jgi:predicted DNA-binding helix-hairpin-helix protein